LGWKNGDKLWPWYSYLTILSSAYFVVTFLIVSSAWAMSVFDFGLVGFGPAFSLGVMAATQGLNAYIALILLQRLRSRNSMALHWFVGSMVLTALVGSWLILAFGVAIFLSEGFRNDVQPWAPKWYQSFVAALFKSSQPLA
jgi:hypothetical protein